MVHQIQIMGFAPKDPVLLQIHWEITHSWFQASPNLCPKCQVTGTRCFPAQTSCMIKKALGQCIFPKASASVGWKDVSHETEELLVCMKFSLGWRENEETETAIVCQWMECTQLQFLQKSSQLQTLTFNTGKDIGYIALPRLHFCSVETGNPWSVLKSRRLNECKSLKLQGNRLTWLSRCSIPVSPRVTAQQCAGRQENGQGLDACLTTP